MTVLYGLNEVLDPIHEHTTNLKEDFEFTTNQIRTMPNLQLRYYGFV